MRMNTTSGRLLAVCVTLLAALLLAALVAASAREGFFAGPFGAITTDAANILTTRCSVRCSDCADTAGIHRMEDTAVLEGNGTTPDTCVFRPAATSAEGGLVPQGAGDCTASHRLAADPVVSAIRPGRYLGADVCTVAFKPGMARQAYRAFEARLRSADVDATATFTAKKGEHARNARTIAELIAQIAAREAEKASLSGQLATETAARNTALADKVECQARYKADYTDSCEPGLRGCKPHVAGLTTSIGKEDTDIARIARDTTTETNKRAAGYTQKSACDTDAAAAAATATTAQTKVYSTYVSAGTCKERVAQAKAAAVANL